MALIWGTNYAIVKSAFRDIDPQAFNALRLILASVTLTLPAAPPDDSNSTTTFTRRRASRPTNGSVSRASG